ncbi:MAG TPA: CHAT domain-containing protein [Flavilitoribacter sp.]|nr:CHAT domain-containing protein [Flavilitoribacter sp.]
MRTIHQVKIVVTGLVGVLLISCRTFGISQPVFDSNKITGISFGSTLLAKYIYEENRPEILKVAKNLRKNAIEIGWGDAAINSNNVMTRTYLELLELDSAKLTIHKGFEIFSDLAVSDLGRAGHYFTTGYYYLNTAALDSAVFYLSQVPDYLNNPTLENFDFIPEQYESWKKLLSNKGLNMDLQLNLIRGHTYNALGLAYIGLLEHERADNYFQLAIDYYGKAQNPKEEGIAWINRGIAWQIPSTYEKKFCLTSIKYFESGLKAMVRSESIDSAFIGAVHRQLGFSHLINGDTSGAYLEFKEAEPFLLASDGKELSFKLFVPVEAYKLSFQAELTAFRSIFEPKEQVLGIIRMHEMKLDSILESDILVDDETLFGIFANIGSAYSSLGEWESANRILKRGIERQWTQDNPYETADFDTRKFEVSNIMSGINFILNVAYGYEKEFRMNHLESSFEKSRRFYEAASEIIDHKRLALSASKSRIMVYRNSLLNSDYLADLAYSGMIRIIAEKRTHNDADREEIFRVMEKSKAYLLLRNLKNIEHFKNAPGWLKEKERRFRDVIQDCSFRLSKARRKSDTEKIAQYSLELKTAEDSLENYYAGLTGADSLFFNFSYTAPIRTTDEIRKRLLDPKSALIEYKMQDDQLLAVFISSDTSFYRFNLKPSKLDMDSLISLYLEFINKSENYNVYAAVNSYKESGYELYRILVEPFIPYLEGKEHLIIIPSGPLHRLNFECLLTADTFALPDREDKYFKQIPDYGKFPYLIWKYSFQYAHSSELLLLQTDLVYKPDEKGYLNYAGFEPTYKYWKDKVYQDFDEVSKTIPFFKEPVKKWVKGNAYEDAFRKAAADYLFGVLHFSCHGELNDAQPELSRLILTNGPNLQSDGYLTVGELVNLDVRANLGIISACSSGNSYFYGGGNGLISIGQGFFYAGCPSLILGLWDIDTQATEMILTKMSQTMIEDKQRVGRALRNAKMDYIQSRSVSTGKKTPYYWGGLTLWGKNPDLFPR